MIKKMLLSNNALHFSKADLPLLIHGDDGYGASLFSVSAIADLYVQGADIVFLCGYHMARDEFDQQTQSKRNSVTVSEGFESAYIESKRVVYILSERPQLLIRVLESLDDPDKTIVFFKNFDLFEESVFTIVENIPNLVLMGNIDKCSYKNRLLDKEWVTQIYFSVPQTEVQTKIPRLEKYTGFLKSDTKEGIVSLVQ